MLKAIVEDFGNGGTIDGDLVVSGDLTVSGGGSLSFDEIIEGTQVIDVTSTEALLVRKNGDGGDVFKVDTQNTRVGIGSTFSPSYLLHLKSGDNVMASFESTDANASIYLVDSNTTADATLKRVTNDLILLESGGSVGIGASPTNNLHIEADSGDEGITIHSAGDTSNAVILDANRSGADSGIGNMLGKWNGTLIGYMGFFSGADTTNKDDGVIKFATTPSGGSATVALTIDSSQNATFGGDVGIGVTPTKRLELGGGTSGQTLLFSNTGVNTTNGARVQANIRYKTGSYAGQNTIQIVTETQFDDSSAVVFNTGGSSAERLRITSGGKIGIGTNLPSGKLTLSNGSASAPLSITASNSYIQLGSEDFGSGGLGKFMIGFGYTDVLTNTNAPAYIGFEETSTSGDTKGDLTFYTRDVTTDTAPTKRLTIGADGNATFAGDVFISNSTPILRLDDSDVSTNVSLDGSGGIVKLASHAGQTIRFLIGSTEVSRFDSSGRLGIGTSSLSDKLEIADGAVNGSTYMNLNNNHADQFLSLGINGNVGEIAVDNGDSLSFGTYTNKSTKTLTTALTIDSSQNIGIGSTPKTHLDVQSYQADGITIGADNDANRTRTNSTSKSGGITGVHYTNAEESIRLIGYSSSSSANTLLLGGGNGDWNSATNINFYVGANTTTTAGDLRFKLDTNSRISISNNDSGTLNTVFGYQSGTALASGSTENTVFGHQAGLALSTGDYNTAVGALALKSEDGGNRAVAVGTSCMFSQNVSDQSRNVAVGFAASYHNVTGVQNTAVGYEALGGSSGNSHDNNTAIGYDALHSVSTGRQNVAVGSACGDAITAGVQNVIVGADSDISAVDAGNEIVLGYGVTGQGSNKATIGNADITDVYMASDSGATVHCAGIQFPASQVANGGANVLDDYEEGEHTSVITCGNSGTVTLDGTNNKLSYVKIGSMVTVNGLLSVSSVSSPDGYFTFSVPFTLGDGTGLSKRCSGSVTVYGVSGLDVNQFVVVGIEAEARIRVYAGNATSIVNDSANALVASSAILVSITYFV
jgi:hypothetical protein